LRKLKEVIPLGATRELGQKPSDGWPERTPEDKYMSGLSLDLAHVSLDMDFPDFPYAGCPMRPNDFVSAARVPGSLKPQAFGLWTIRRVAIADQPTASVWAQMEFLLKIGFRSQTQLWRHTWATIHLPHGELVMEDSARELRKHLPIWLNAKGRVLVTGLGLGCVVRGLLASPKVEHITVVEIDANILRIVGHEFRFNKCVTLIHGDALKVQLPGRFDYAWHDLHSSDGERHLQLLHAELLDKFYDQVTIQGAWELPRWFKRKMPDWILR
jgi:hypothetical protein